MNNISTNASAESFNVRLSLGYTRTSLNVINKLEAEKYFY